MKNLEKFQELRVVLASFRNGVRQESSEAKPDADWALYHLVDQLSGIVDEIVEAIIKSEQE